MKPFLLIVGASGRAAAASALRAGFDPFVIDLFADADTKRLCPVLSCDPTDYPHGFLPLAKAAPSGAWMYTGGLENYPDLVAAISEGRELLGNGPEQLTLCRDPYRLADAVRAAGGNYPETIPLGTTPPAGGNWLRKSVASAGGLHVRFAKSTDFDPASANVRECLQRFIDGRPMSALFRQDAGETHLFGLTRQLIGTSWLHAPEFGYAGNITVEDASLAAGMVIHLRAYADFDLRHCWGTDFMDRGSGTPWTIEVNPRYTAGVEVLEYATRRAFLGPARPTPAPRSAVGKGIYYAPVPLTFPGSGPWDESLARCADVWRRPDFADIPEAGTLIEVGQPVLTIFAEAGTVADCEAALRRRAADLDSLFDWRTSDDPE